MTEGKRGVIFDLGGVLLSDTWARQMAHCASVLEVDAELLSDACSNGVYQLFMQGNISEERFWKRICGQLGVNPPRMHSLWGDGFRSAVYEHPEMWELVAHLRQAGIPVGILSNAEMPVYVYFEQQQYGSRVDGVVFSCLEGCSKPDRLIFEKAASTIGLPLTSTVLVDDRSENVEGARKVGMKAIEFKRTPENPGACLTLKQKLAQALELRVPLK